MASILYSPALDAAADIRRVISSPFISGPLLFSITHAPQASRNAFEEITNRIPAVHLIGSSMKMSSFTTALRVLFSLSLVRQLNETLSRMAANSWRFTTSEGWEWSREVAVVTGGSIGIGKAIVEKLSQMEIRVAVLDVQELPKSLESDSHIRFYKCDVTSSESISAAADAIRKELGHPSILINNAGVTRPTPILKMPETYLNTVFGVNCLTLVDDATILATYDPNEQWSCADYSASKSGALALHESLACELKHYYKAPNVLTRVVHPNFVRTPLLEESSDYLERSGVRMLTAEQVAGPVVAQLESRRGGQLIIPRSASSTSGIRGWPTWLQELLRDILGRQSF